MREFVWADIGKVIVPHPDATAWVLGSGPSLDTVDLDLLEGEHVFAVNASAVYSYSAACAATTWWVVNNVGAVEDSCDRVPAPWRMIACERCRRVIEPRAEKVAEVVYYTKSENFPFHTTVESAMSAAARTGFKRIVLIGVDCDPTVEYVYAERARHQQCIYNQKERRYEYMGRFVSSIERWALVHIRELAVYTTSSVFPGKFINHVPYDWATKVFRGDRP